MLSQGGGEGDRTASKPSAKTAGIGIFRLFRASGITRSRPRNR